MKINMPVTQREIELGEAEVIVSKTDLKGQITYINREFVTISGFSEEELIGKSHNIVRHPDMPAGHAGHARGGRRSFSGVGPVFGERKIPLAKDERAGFIAAVDPPDVFISCGVRNRFDHPHPNTMRTLGAGPSRRAVHRTDRGGERRWSTDGDAIEITSPFEGDALDRLLR